MNKTYKELMKYLIKNGYTFWRTEKDYVTMQHILHKKAKSDCENNRFLIIESTTTVVPDKPFIELSFGIKARKNKEWFIIKCYSVDSINKKKLVKIEKSLIRAFNAI